ncbi:MAG: hypothetical protein MI749_20710, partial [Desulfovibrionales bacterium]|nr:hypothetical protein [Desulfovibrionales bacterium]
DAAGRILTFGAYSQLCLYSEDATQWNRSAGVAVTDTGEEVGPFSIVTVTDGGHTWHRAAFWETIHSGQPAGKLYFSIYYQAGTSGGIHLECKDNGINDGSIYKGAIGSAVITSQNAGSLTILSDEEDSELGCRVLKATIDFTNKANSLSIGIGPNSTNNSDIRILGADVFDTGGTWRPHVPSSGSVVAVSATYSDENGGDPFGPRLQVQPDAIGSFYTGTSLWSDLSDIQNATIDEATEFNVNDDTLTFKINHIWGQRPYKAPVAWEPNTTYELRADFDDNMVNVSDFRISIGYTSDVTLDSSYKVDVGKVEGMTINVSAENDYYDGCFLSGVLTEKS